MGRQSGPIDYDMIFADRGLVVGVAQRNSVRRLVKRLRATHALCILDDQRPLFLPPSISRACFLRLTFDDVLDPLHSAAPQRHHVETIVAWARDLPGGARVAINCEAGQSRSTAAAMILMTARGIPPGEARELLLAVRPTATPNSLMIRLGDEVLGLGGELGEVIGGLEYQPLGPRREGRW